MDLSELLGIKYPIIGGAMARIANAKFAASISNAGGLGIIAGGGLSKEDLRSEIRECKKLTSHPFGVNIMLMAPNKDELAHLLVEEKVKVVTTGAGNPEPYIEMWKQSGIKGIPVIASVKHAKKMEALKVDAVIAEGMEAGGHIGSITTMCLLPQVVDAVKIPVIAAGGIADARVMLAVEILGAVGVQIGTRFLATLECPISENYKQALLCANDTVITGYLSGNPVRVLKNKMTEKYLKLEKQSASKEELENITFGSLQKAIQGDIENGSMMCGQVVAMIDEIKSVEDVILELMDGYRQLKERI